MTTHLDLVGKKCFSLDGKEAGTITGMSECRLEGCRGTRISVRWPDGKRTFPCLRGCTVLSDGNVRIGMVREDGTWE
jgi:hypothetical protein